MEEGGLGGGKNQILRVENKEVQCQVSVTEEMMVKLRWKE